MVRVRVRVHLGGDNILTILATIGHSGGRCHGVSVLAKGHGLKDDQAGTSEGGVEATLTTIAAHPEAVLASHTEGHRPLESDDGIRVNHENFFVGQDLGQDNAASFQKDGASSRNELACYSHATTATGGGTAVKLGDEVHWSNVRHVGSPLCDQSPLDGGEVDGNNLGRERGGEGNVPLITGAVMEDSLAAALADTRPGAAATLKGGFHTG